MWYTWQPDSVASLLVRCVQQYRIELLFSNTFFPISALILAIAAWIFGDAERSYSGFFSRNGEPFDGCLSHGFGLAIAAMAVDVFGSVVSFSALCSSKFWDACKESKVFKKKD